MRRPDQPVVDHALQFAAGAQFEQAKNPAKSAQFLQIVAKPKPAARKKPEPKLTRVAFAVQIVLDETQLDAVRAAKQKAKKKSGDFTDDNEVEP